MKIEDIKPKEGSTKNKKRVGRGNSSGQGGECGRGHKGQRSRSGFSQKIGFEGGQMPLYRRMPKKKGFRNINRLEYYVVNLNKLNEICVENDQIDIEYLIKKNVLKNTSKPLKILGSGEINKKITISADSFSKSAISKLEKAKCEIKLV